MYISDASIIPIEMRYADEICCKDKMRYIILDERMM